jgi:hypothetical protein
MLEGPPSAAAGAASREIDNDFHLIVGRDPSAKPSVYMTVEVSGLPPKRSKAFSKLNAARTVFKAFFGAQGGRPGPATLRSHIPTIWEVHPLSKIAFKQ